MIYFDNAATTGVKPKSVVRAVNFALENLSANPGRSGHRKSVQAAETVYKAREKLSDFFGSGGPETVVF
ncbi:MAG: aminotransferase class V-fold PLP-dependent enzyme, partial [Acutalibacteraceae bacterium]|nr:aminotransferase class V-fold PLP-dependent enzyme [Acutalibacteraceae bacterium]